MDSAILTRLGIDASVWGRPLSATFALYDILTDNREQMFLAQMAHESQGFTRIAENLNYTAAGLLANFPTHFTEAQAAQYAHKPEAIANYAYANRNGNGDEASGDGWRYRGGGLCHLTGRANYLRAGRALGLDLVMNPDVIRTDPMEAARVGGWFWSQNGCNELADAGNFVGTTRRINGGLNGQPNRDEWLRKVRKVWHV